MPSNTDPNEPQVIGLPRAQLPFAVPGLFELAQPVDNWPQDNPARPCLVKLTPTPLSHGLSQEGRTAACAELYGALAVA